MMCITVGQSFTRRQYYNNILHSCQDDKLNTSRILLLISAELGVEVEQFLQRTGLKPWLLATSATFKTHSIPKRFPSDKLSGSSRSTRAFREGTSHSVTSNLLAATILSTRSI